MTSQIAVHSGTVNGRISWLVLKLAFLNEKYIRYRKKTISKMFFGFSLNSKILCTRNVKKCWADFHKIKKLCVSRPLVVHHIFLFK